ncbi:DUF6503 family protein [Arenibacter sp. GZD96]|uniref:DUF6503 family protein n=1 Tax=Aurantibrevibacter litoralis TaxID=3106030 RepID=UPI002AFF4742|nr:DUF6503 family protein [Arenibacter sp. GZD-96]MEA1787605.1 DUF6503 family protein [Arenibacter sp. GZD-96]
MIRIAFILFLIFSLRGTEGIGQEISASELLDKAIGYHDPYQEWKDFRGTLSVILKTPQAEDRISDITLDFPKAYFKLTVQKEGNSVAYTIAENECTLALNGSTAISNEDREAFNLSCDRAHMMKDYYTYLYGLPMKLRDPGTRLDPLVQKKKFLGKTYFVLKVTYDASVGSDTWYFYINPTTYALEGYQFFKDEAKNDGEYIVLSGEEQIKGMRIPKNRAWYYNKDDGYLGTDVLTKITTE